MCGIAGISRKACAVSHATLDKLAAALAHRGPDGTGRHADGDSALVHTRLAIIDLETGDQPLYWPDGAALIANGEIYNYIELRREFPAASFRTHSDCETALAAYARDGSAFARSLRGMYAIALYDPAKRQTLLTRDPFGIKPLYYAKTEQGVSFASEPQALVQAGLAECTLRTDKARELLQAQFTTGRDTIYSGIARVLPGETLEIAQGEISVLERRAALPAGPPRLIAEDEALKTLDAVLMDSVAVHQRSDVPYGMFFSGGIDSSALLVCMARLNERPVRAFTAGFPGTSAHDERAHAARIAKAVGAEHIEISVTDADFWAQLPQIVAALDDPASDYAAIPSYLLAREAAKELKVVLCGEGGDELFAGYGRYRTAVRPWWRGGRPMRRRGLLDGLGILRDQTPRWRDGIAAAERNAFQGAWTKLQQVQATDCAEWLPNDLLIKLDRCLMAHGLEGRTPFLDPEVGDFAFRLPDSLKIGGKTGKYLLRRWLHEALPAADAFSHKRGFTVPVADWIGPMAAKLGPLVSACAGIAEQCAPGTVERLFAEFAAQGGKRKGTACWQLLFYALWHRIHIESVPSEGDVFAVLEAA